MCSNGSLTVFIRSKYIRKRQSQQRLRYTQVLKTLSACSNVGQGLAPAENKLSLCKNVANAQISTAATPHSH